MSEARGFEKAALLLHLHDYAFTTALVKTLGPVQAIFMNEYASNLIKLAEKAGIEMSKVLKGFSYYRNFLRGIGLVKDIVLEKKGNTMKVVVEDCSLAEIIHRALDLKGPQELLCPLATIAMVVLAREHGYSPDNGLFNFIRFTDEYSYFTESGTITIFKLTKTRSAR
ncbi:MAG: hypothetical protein DRN15_08110 [Thermoprotei archaeon]|nr:MAG: hypothetical protein DRM97_05625 [Thermoprotei archaeon]RLF22797.1 MAG: hypothetical protein DRN15_08110 [Thermoprotei archaeon]